MVNTASDITPTPRNPSIQPMILPCSLLSPSIDAALIDTDHSIRMVVTAKAT
ncbi:hypothetical protein D3C87_1950900 [compost metagenome]